MDNFFSKKLILINLKKIDLSSKLIKARKLIFRRSFDCPKISNFRLNPDWKFLKYKPNGTQFESKQFLYIYKIDSLMIDRINFYRLVHHLRKYWKIILKNSSFEYHSNHSNTNSFTNHTANRSDSNLKNYGAHKGKVNNEDFNEAYRSTSTVSLFGSGLQKTFATGNLSRICQIPVINPINKSNGSNFNDDSEPIYTDPSLFERSRWVLSSGVS